jgi:outer membrane protein assembly factor BamA
MSDAGPLLDDARNNNERLELVMRRVLILLPLFAFHPFVLDAQLAPDSAIIVRDIQIVGNRTTKEYVILREMSLRSGDTLTQAALERDRDNIYNLQLFNKVDVDYTVDQNRATVVVTVSERWYFIPFPILGMKYRDPSKLYYGAGVVHENFRGRNEKLFASICFGYDRWFALNYQNPKITDNDDIFAGASLTLQKIHNLSNSYGEYENSNVIVSGTLGKRFGIYRSFYATAGYELWGVNDPLAGRTVSPTGQDRFFVAMTQYRYDTRNNKEYTTNGALLSVSIAKDGFGESEINLVSVAYDVKKFFALGSESGLGLHTSGSFTWGGLIPPYLHAFFGYSDRIRGYFYKVIEAEDKVAASIELRLPILTPRYLELDFIKIPEFQKLRYGLYFGIFADAGKAWHRTDIVARRPWYSGYGAGFQFLLPYGFTIRTEGAINNYGVGEFILDFDTSF